MGAKFLLNAGPFLDFEVELVDQGSEFRISGFQL